MTDLGIGDGFDAVERVAADFERQAAGFSNRRTVAEQVHLLKRDRFAGIERGFHRSLAHAFDAGDGDVRPIGFEPGGNARREAAAADLEERRIERAMARKDDFISQRALAGKRVLVLLCGANIDFLQIGLVAQSVGAADQASRSLRVRIPERPGTMLELLDSCFAGINIADFQYGKTSETSAWPIFTLSSDDPAGLDELPKKLDAGGFDWQELTAAEDVAFRAIPLRGDLLHNPVFLRLDFYERPGALHDFLDQRVRGNANICYFNYRQSGERIGRALIGLDFPSPFERDAMMMAIPSHGDGYRLCERLDEQTCARLTGRSC